jgi:hypothetical protein
MSTSRFGPGGPYLLVDMDRGSKSTGVQINWDTGINSVVAGKFSDPPVIMTGITSRFISRPAYNSVVPFCRLLSPHRQILN